MEDGEVEAVCENLISLYFNISKERKYYSLIGFDEDSFKQWIISGDYHLYLNDRKVFIYVDNAKIRKGSMYSAHLTTIVTEFKEQIVTPTAAYTAKILSKIII